MADAAPPAPPAKGVTTYSSIAPAVPGGGKGMPPALKKKMMAKGKAPMKGKAPAKGKAPMKGKAKK